MVLALVARRRDHVAVIELLLPPRLPPGGNIAVVATSWGGVGELPARAARAFAALDRLGYRVTLMPHAGGTADGPRDWVSAGAVERLADLHAAFADPTVDLVLSAIGGNHSAHLLEGLDLDLIRSHPKPFCGYSDTTTLLQAIHARTGLVTFYGPALLPEFGEIGGPDTEVVEHFLRVVGSAEPAGPVPVVGWQATEDRAMTDSEDRGRERVTGEPRRLLRPGSGAGPLLAGCLPSMRNLIGTPWQPDFAGRVLVVETPEAPYDAAWADADLAHLRNAGALTGLAALVLGRTEGWTPAQVGALHACALDAARGYDYPVLAGVEVTHSAPLLTIPIGVPGRVDGLELVIEGAAVS